MILTYELASMCKVNVQLTNDMYQLKTTVPDSSKIIML